MSRVLCVDDDSSATDLKRNILQRAGYEVITCNSAEHAIAILHQSNFDAVITDWRLGVQSGRAIVEAAKATSNAPVVVVSGHMSEAFRAAEPRADLYLEKPFDPEELLKVLETLLGGRQEA